MSTSTNWLIMQLADSSFPSGAFAHSGGLEAAWQAGEVTDDDLVDYLRASLTQAVHSQLPFAMGAYQIPERFDSLDHLCDALLTNHVANRASRRQGRTLVASCQAVFGCAAISRLRARVIEGSVVCHYAPTFGAVTRALGMDRGGVQQLFLFLVLRGLVSSALRLGIIGPLEGQRIQHELGPWIEATASRCGTIGVDQVAQTAPVVEILQGSHDRLYSRLFQN